MAKKRTQQWGYTKALQRTAEQATNLTRQGRVDEAKLLRQYHDNAYESRVEHLANRRKGGTRPLSKLHPSMRQH